MKQFISAKPFPEVICGDNFMLQLHHSDDDNHIAEFVNMIRRNRDFSDFLDVRYYLNVDSAKKIIKQREEFAKNGLLADYAITQLFTGKIFGGICFVNHGDKSVGVTYYLDRQYRGLGFVSKALKIAEPELAEIGFEKVVLDINEKNSNSINVAKKNNFVFNETGYPMKNFVKIIKGYEH